MAFTIEETDEFKTEANELLDEAERSLLALDTGSTFAAEYDAVFRAFHSIKGASGMMEMTALQEHMHRLENLLVEQKPKTVLERSFVDHFLKGIDASRRLLDGEHVNFDHQVEAPVLRAVTPVPKVSATQKPRVLVIDDEPTLIELLQQILEARGFEVASFTSPTDAIAAIAEFKPEVVLTDIQMPGMNGLEVLKTVREKYPDLPVVFVSGHADKEILLEAINNGVYAVLEKPFHKKDVVEICRNAIERHRLVHLVNSSINLLIYQFADLDDFLVSQGKIDVKNAIGTEIKKLIEQRRRLKQIA